MKTEIDELAKLIYSFLRVDTMSRALASLLYGEGYRKAIDVAFEAIDNFRDVIVDVFIGMCRGNDYNKVNLLQIGDAIDAVYDKQIAELKKKYESEGADDA